jgi:hypothetical protein
MPWPAPACELRGGSPSPTAAPTVIVTIRRKSLGLLHLAGEWHGRQVANGNPVRPVLGDYRLVGKPPQAARRLGLTTSLSASFDGSSYLWAARPTSGLAVRR